MGSINDVLLRAVFAFGVSVVGAALAAQAARQGRERRIDLLVDAAAGALLGVTLFALFPEAAEVLRPAELILAAASGYGLFFLVGRYIAPVCPACAASSPSPAPAAATLLSLALGLHALADGMAIAAGHDAHGSGATNLPVLLAVSLHKLPEGLALCALLIGGGKSVRQALWLTVAVESLTLVGGFLGDAALLHAAPAFLGAIFAHLGGGFLYLVFHGIRPTHRETLPLARRFALGGAGFVGVAVLFAVLHKIGV